MTVASDSRIEYHNTPHRVIVSGHSDPSRYVLRGHTVGTIVIGESDKIPLAVDSPDRPDPVVVEDQGPNDESA